MQTAGDGAPDEARHANQKGGLAGQRGGRVEHLGLGVGQRNEPPPAPLQGAGHVVFLAASAFSGCCCSATFTAGNERSCSLTGAAWTKDTGSLPGKLLFSASSSFLSRTFLSSVRLAAASAFD